MKQGPVSPLEQDQLLQDVVRLNNELEAMKNELERREHLIAHVELAESAGIPLVEGGYPSHYFVCEWLLERAWSKEPEAIIAVSDALQGKAVKRSVRLLAPRRLWTSGRKKEALAFIEEMPSEQRYRGHRALLKQHAIDGDVAAFRARIKKCDRRKLKDELIGIETDLVKAVAERDGIAEAIKLKPTPWQLYQAFEIVAERYSFEEAIEFADAHFREHAREYCYVFLLVHERQLKDGGKPNLDPLLRWAKNFSSTGPGVKKLGSVLQDTYWGVGTQLAEAGWLDEAEALVKKLKPGQAKDGLRRHIAYLRSG